MGGEKSYSQLALNSSLATNPIISDVAKMFPLRRQTNLGGILLTLLKQREKKYTILKEVLSAESRESGSILL